MEQRPQNVPPPAAVPAPLRKKILFASVPLVVVLMLVEGTCRLFGWGAPEVAPPSDAAATYRDVELTAPDGHKSTYREREYVGVPVRTNEHGFRDWSYDAENRERAVRVAGVGDSFTFGDGLGQEDTWLRRLEAKLAPLAPDGRPLRTMNFGRRGANTAEETSMLEAHVLPFRPDLVVLGFTLFNDAETAAYRAESTKEHVAREQSWLRKTVRWVHDNSYAVNAVSDRIRRGKKRADMVAHIESEYADDAPGWIECRASLAKFAGLCRDRGIPLIVLVFPAHHRDPVLNDWARYEFKAQHDKIRAALAAFPDVVVVDMAEHLADLSGKRIWIEGNGHPDAVYAERVAETLAAPAARLLGFARR